MGINFISEIEWADDPHKTIKNWADDSHKTIKDWADDSHKTIKNWADDPQKTINKDKIKDIKTNKTPLIIPKMGLNYKIELNYQISIKNGVKL